MMMYAELGFNLVYLAFIWFFVIKMHRNKNIIPVEDQQIAKFFYYAFLLLAIGDTGHVGFRVLAYALGGLDSTLHIFNYDFPLVGAGALSTAITLTIFYMYLVVIWKVRFNKKALGPYLAFQVIGVGRLIIMCFPQNEWANVVPPSEWSIYRNLPLIIVGFGLISHIFIANRKIGDKFYRNIAWLILASFLFYLPVVLFIQKVPMLGMLMIPKTIAYVLIAFLVFKRYFWQKEVGGILH